MFDVHQQHPRDTSIAVAFIIRRLSIEEDRREIVEYLPSVTDLFAIGGVKLCVVLS